MHRIYQQATTLDLSQIPPQHLTDQDRTLSVKVENSINDAKDIQHYRICQLNQNPINDFNLPNIIFERKINANTTHIVLDADIHGLVSPSYLYRIGILCGCYIVNENWLKICKEKNQMVPEERFEIQGDTTHGRTGAPCKARTNRNLKKPNLFKGTRVKVIAEPKSKVEKLLLAGRAILEGDFDTVVVCNPKEVNISELRQTYPGKLLISGDWVNDCVDSYEIVKKDSYILTE
ncbi:hypothetical protein EDC96DRAFT_51182 [Choanephora cucurbitarum]|nr:hypothetical protein EDC96DRAFT_51182 [Choanephora cucurbitarum]